VYQMCIMCCINMKTLSSLPTFALQLDLAKISTDFSGTITNKFCFTFTLEDVTAMPRGLHAWLCHAFLVYTRAALAMRGY